MPSSLQGEYRAGGLGLDPAGLPHPWGTTSCLAASSTYYTSPPASSVRARSGLEWSQSTRLMPRGVSLAMLSCSRWVGGWAGLQLRQPVVCGGRRGAHQAEPGAAGEARDAGVAGHRHAEDPLPHEQGHVLRRAAQRGGEGRAAVQVRTMCVLPSDLSETVPVVRVLFCACTPLLRRRHATA